MKTFALIGNPNSGKTTLFNSLTGSTGHVGNWPGVTVEKKLGTYLVGEEYVKLLDLPGIYSLSPYSPEEIITREVILSQTPDCLINIVDATNIERNLYLSTQLLEVDIPIIIALNMMDIIEKKGDVIKIKELEERLGVPVIAISALKEQSLDYLMTKAYETSLTPRKAESVLKDSKAGPLLQKLEQSFLKQAVHYPLFHAIKLLEDDDLEKKDHPDLIPLVEKMRESFHDPLFGSDFEALFADGRYQFITQSISYIVMKRHEDEKVKKETNSIKIDKVLTNKWIGLPIFFLILFFIFHFTFSEDLFFLKALHILPNGGVTSFPGHPLFEGLFASGGLNSFGVILANLIQGITQYLLNLAATLLESSPQWVSAFLLEGVLGGLFAVISFIPQILVLFLFFSILEDSGYMARIAFILDRLFRQFGLSGRAFLPMVMGFGCAVPATINTRGLIDEKERIATIRVIPFFSCGAKLPILTAVSGAIIVQFGLGHADLITYGMYLLGILTAIISVLIMRQTTLKGETSPFIMELPPYRLPQVKSTLIHLWDKLKHFLEKAFTIILTSTIIIWFLSHFSLSFRFDLAIENSLLAGIARIIQPIFTPLGFGSQLVGNYSWVFVVAAFTGLIAKENVIATFATLALSMGLTSSSGTGVNEVVMMIQSTGILIPGLISFIAFNMTTIPCLATVATAKAELPKGHFKWTLLFWIGTSYFLAMTVYLFGSFPWTILIYVGIGLVYIIYLVIRRKFVTIKKV